MYILNPDPHLLPSYRISPFSTKDVTNNNNFPKASIIDEYFDIRFSAYKYYYCVNGREAISIALSSYDLHSEDIVSILTTSGNFYISSCVTKEIEKFCKWSRKIEEKTKVIFVNHEFGYPYENMEELKKYGLPIIEDCAQAFFSLDKENIIGKIGDFVIYSFPKMFPMQIGGLLVAKQSIRLKEQSIIESETLQWIKNILSHYIIDKDKITHKRIEVYQILISRFKDFGFLERFELKEGIIPGVFLFRINDKKVDLTELKKYIYAHGIQCSVFYGENSFFIPCHQNLNYEDIEYFTRVFKSYFQ